MLPFLADSANEATIGVWWDVAQKVGSGGALVLLVVTYFMAKALVAKDAQVVAEVTYSKDLGKQMLTVTSELTTVVKGMDTRDSKKADEDRVTNGQLMQAITNLNSSVNELRGTVNEHIKTTDARISRAA